MKRKLSRHVLRICVVAFVLCMSTQIVFAKDIKSSNANGFESINQLVTYEDSVPVIKVNSEEEYNQVMYLLEENNARVEELWDKAVQESLLPENDLVKVRNDAISNSLYATRDLKLGYVRENAYETIGWYPKAHLCYSAMYYRGYNNYYYVEEVNGISMTPTNSDTDVNVLDSDYRVIDGRRTIATNFSSVVHVDKWGEGRAVYNWTHYVEFYASGGSQIF